MLIGYARVSKADGSQLLDLQRDALQASTPSTSTTTSRPASATTETPRPAFACSVSRPAATAISSLWKRLKASPRCWTHPRHTRGSAGLKIELP